MDKTASWWLAFLQVAVRFYFSIFGRCKSSKQHRLVVLFPTFTTFFVFYYKQMSDSCDFWHHSGFCQNWLLWTNISLKTDDSFNCLLKEDEILQRRLQFAVVKIVRKIRKWIVFDNPRSVVSIFFFFRTCCCVNKSGPLCDCFYYSASGVYTRYFVNESRLFFWTTSRRFPTLKHSSKCLLDCKLVRYCNIEYV